MNNTVDINNLSNKNLIVLDEKNMKTLLVFVGLNLYWIGKSLVLKFPQTTENMKDYDRDKYLTIINNEENE